MFVAKYRTTPTVEERLTKAEPTTAPQQPAAGSAGTAPPSQSPSPRADEWQRLLKVECPVAGFALTPEGLVQKSSGRVLDALELREMISEVTRLESSAHARVDGSLLTSMRGRVTDKSLRSYTPVLLGGALFFGFYKVPKAYRNAEPQKSIIAKMQQRQLDLSMRELEGRCISNRRLYQATHPRVLLFAAASALLSVGALACAASSAGRKSWETREAEHTLQYGAHMKRTCRYLWQVYYHHPHYVAVSDIERGKKDIKSLPWWRSIFNSSATS